MKTLYISDLDGTLLDSTGRLSNTTTTLLKDIIASGIHFTCATARTEATTSKILAEIPLSAPCILMNGVVILDLQKNHYCFDNNIPIIRIPYDAEYTIDDLKLETTRFLLTPENEEEYYTSRKR